jgi:hypothetical protein
MNGICKSTADAPDQLSPDDPTWLKLSAASQISPHGPLQTSYTQLPQTAAGPRSIHVHHAELSYKYHCPTRSFIFRVQFNLFPTALSIHTAVFS